MHCPRCGFENPEGLKFCNECGTPLRMPCAQCGFANQPQAKFCGECGAALLPQAGASTAPPVAPRPHAPLSYTPTYLAEKILTSKTALEGERKQVTVLFADLKGSMDLLADRDPEDARAILDPVLERMMGAVHRYEGTVNQVMGDGIMALFGAPIAHEDHAVRACYAALAMQASVKQYAGEVQRTRGVPIHIRVGLNSGEVVVRSIGSDLHMDYTAVGQTTHLAARMEQLAMPGSILITPEVLRLAEGYVHVNALGLVPIKGLQAPVEVYEVTGTGPVRSRLQAAAARGLTRFVGRDTELNQLRQALDRAGRGHGQVVAVIGEPGVGKSRLFWEFTQSHRSHGWLHLASSSVSYGKATPYLPVIDLLKGYVGIEAHDEARTRREKVTGKLLTLDRTLEPTLPVLLALLLVGRVDEASALAGRLLELSRTHTGSGYQAHACRLLGEVAIHRDPPNIDQGTAHYRQALALADELSMRPLEAHCHRGLGTLCAKIGQHEQAHVELSAAIALYRSMDMTFWLPQADVALAQVEGRR